MLNFEISPRISRCGEKQIKVEEGNTQVTESMKWQMMLTAVDLGYRYSSKNKRKIIAEAVSKQVSYDHGFKVHVGQRAFQDWFQKYEDVLRTGLHNPMKTNYDKRGIQTCYIDSLESEHP